MSEQRRASARIRGSVRRGQLITTYGVGSLVALEDESYIVMGLDRWVVGEPDCREQRLERVLNVRGFVLPPASDDRDDIPVARFPQWYYCPTCRHLDVHDRLSPPDRSECGLCDDRLVPSRFVVCCDRGHIDDFPYALWVHEGKSPATLPGKKHELSIEARGESASLSDIIVSCTCGVSRSMEGAFAKDSLRGIARCTGNRPWLGDRESCSLTPRVLQRGASNVWFPVVRSSLSIPPWSEAAFRVLNRHWSVLRYCPEEAVRAYVENERLAPEGSGYSTDDLVEAWRQRREREEGDDSPRPLRREEYEALTRGRVEDSRAQDFVSVPAEANSSEASEWFTRIMEVRRLREVRALSGFSRVMPATAAADGTIAPLVAQPTDWLPAIEVRGEGVFVQFDEERLRRWEAIAGVADRAQRVNDRYKDSFMAVQREPDRIVTPRLLLAHTTAHALIDQWSLECGYPAAALRERLYVDEEMCALLIYTATGDSAGSLGGVIAQSHSDRFFPSLREAVSRFSWCTNDPLCIESEAVGVDSLNMAACHACVLLPEVSCEEGNTLLDRAMLVGTPEHPEIGYFEPLVVRS